MNINYEKQTIEMTKAEAKEAGKYNSEKYIELKEIRTDFPNFRIVTVNTPKKKDPYKGLTYTYMAKYIKTYTKDGDIRRTEFTQMSGYDENGVKIVFAEKATYGEVRAWFLLKFPEIEEYNTKVAELRMATRAQNEAKKESKLLSFPMKNNTSDSEENLENKELENVG